MARTGAGSVHRVILIGPEPLVMRQGATPTSRSTNQIHMPEDGALLPIEFF